MNSILCFFFGTAEKRNNRIADTIVWNNGSQKFSRNGKYFKDRSKGECDLSDVCNGLCTLNLTELAYADRTTWNQIKVLYLILSVRIKETLM